MTVFNIYLTGVGGQGIGLISEAILRAADHAGHAVKSVDTHGLAQRGGIVISHIRMGETVFSPLIPQGRADLAISLERHEALRSAGTMLKENGCLIYYNTVWQPLEVRLKKAEEIGEELISRECQRRNIREIRVFKPDLTSALMQNMVVLAKIGHYGLIPEIETGHYRQAMADLMEGRMLADNMAVFDAER